MGGLKLGLEAQAKFDEAKINPDKAGNLDKKGAKRKNWNNRWFVLKDNYLFYCKNEKSLPQGIINLHGCTVSKIEGPTARQFAFSLLAPKSVSIDAKWTNRTYLMSAKNPEDYRSWMETLESAGRKSVERAQAAKAAAGGFSSSPAPKEGDKAAPAGQKAEVDSDSESGEAPAPAKHADGPLPIKREDSKGNDLRPRKKEESSGESGSEDERAPKAVVKSESKSSVKKDESSSGDADEVDKLPRTPDTKKHRHKDKKEKRERKEKRKEKKNRPKDESDSAENSA